MGWLHCSLKTIEGNDNVDPKPQCLARCLTKRDVGYACDTFLWVFVFLRGQQNIVRHLLNKLTLSLFSTRVEINIFYNVCPKSWVRRYSKLRVGEKHTHKLSRLHFNLLEPHLSFFFCFCFALWTPSSPRPGCGPLTPSTFLSEVY